MAGDRAGALQCAQVHAKLLREELGLEPDPVVDALAARLREPMSWAAPNIPGRGHGNVDDGAESSADDSQSVLELDSGQSLAPVYGASHDVPEAATSNEPPAEFLQSRLPDRAVDSIPVSSWQVEACSTSSSVTFAQL